MLSWDSESTELLLSSFLYFLYFLYLSLRQTPSMTHTRDVPMKATLTTLARALAIAISIPSLSAANAAADSVQTFLVTNAWLDGNSSGWAFDAPWQYEANVGGGAAMFVTNSDNAPGSYAATFAVGDLTQRPEVTGLADYSPTTTALTGVSFSNPWRIGHFGDVPTNGDYAFSIQLDIDTPAGTYRASSQVLDRSEIFINQTTNLPLNFSWLGGPFLGDPFTSTGVTLNEIDSIDYRVVVDIQTPTSSNAGFFNIEGFNLQGTVTSYAIPEPATGAFTLMLVSLFAPFGARRQRRR
jgi:hypothetical protein